MMMEFLRLFLNTLQFAGEQRVHYTLHYRHGKRRLAPENHLYSARFSETWYYGVQLVLCKIQRNVSIVSFQVLEQLLGHNKSSLHDSAV